MNIDDQTMRVRVSEARAGRVGTIDERGRVHLVPIVFVIDGDMLYSSTDAGPRLPKRLRNMARDPRVTVLVDDYSEDWSQVWWVRLRGIGRVVRDGPEHDRARQLLAAKYPQFGGDPGDGAVMAVDIAEWSGWSYSG